MVATLLIVLFQVRCTLLATKDNFHTTPESSIETNRGPVRRLRLPAASIACIIPVECSQRKLRVVRETGRVKRGHFYNIRLWGRKLKHVSKP